MNHRMASACRDELEKLALGYIGKQRALRGAGAGAALGGAGGAALDEDNRVRGAVLGALAGSGLGAGAGALYNKLRPVRPGKPYAWMQPLNNADDDFNYYGKRRLNLNEDGPDRDKGMDLIDRVSVLLADGKVSAGGVGRHKKDARVEVFSDQLDSGGRYGYGSTFIPGGADQSDERLKEFAVKHLRSLPSDRTFNNPTFSLDDAVAMRKQVISRNKSP